MTFSLEQIVVLLNSLFWPFVRIAGVLAIAPVIGSPDVPVRVRIILALILAITLQSYIGDIPNYDPLSLQGLLVTFNQFVIGVLIGFVILVVFNVFLVAGESIAGTMGLSFAVMSDPHSGVQVPVISQFFTLLMTLVFLALDGHHMVIYMLASSFIYVPVSIEFAPAGYWQLISWSGILFKGAVMIALPALVTMLAVNLIMGVMTRSSPQLNIFSVGFPITMTFGFLILIMTLPEFVNGFTRLLLDSNSVVERILSSGATP